MSEANTNETYMNDTIRQLLAHRSFRSYTDRPVEQEKLDLVLEAAQRAPNWVNMQQWSVVVVRDKARKAKIAELAGNQKHIDQAPVFLLFCADFSRVKAACDKQGLDMGQGLHNIDNVVMAGQEVGIPMATAVVAAESLGLGTVCIGNIRFHTPEVVELLQLPEYVVPICGLCVGYPDADPGLKPRLPRHTVCFEETYTGSQEAFRKELDAFDELYGKYLAERDSNARDGSWSKTVCGYLANNLTRFPDLENVLAKQKVYVKK